MTPALPLHKTSSPIVHTPSPTIHGMKPKEPICNYNKALLNALKFPPELTDIDYTNPTEFAIPPEPVCPTVFEWHPSSHHMRLTVAMWSCKTIDFREPNMLPTWINYFHSLTGGHGIPLQASRAIFRLLEDRNDLYKLLEYLDSLIATPAYHLTHQVFEPFHCLLSECTIHALKDLLLQGLGIYRLLSTMPALRRLSICIKSRPTPVPHLPLPMVSGGIKRPLEFLALIAPLPTIEVLLSHCHAMGLQPDTLLLVFLDWSLNDLSHWDSLLRNLTQKFPRLVNLGLAFDEAQGGRSMNHKSYSNIFESPSSQSAPMFPSSALLHLPTGMPSPVIKEYTEKRWSKIHNPRAQTVEQYTILCDMRRMLEQPFWRGYAYDIVANPEQRSSP